METLELLKENLKIQSERLLRENAEAWGYETQLK